MSLTDPNEARKLIRALKAQPEKFLFGLNRAIFNAVLALVTPIAKDGPMGKEWAQAHTLVSDVPGTGKTAMFNYLAAGLKAKLGRVDGKPDLMPSDFTGREEKDKFSAIRTVLKGPLFSNIFFADEINRTPPKSQAPMLGAMEGGHVILNVTNEKEGFIEPKSFPLYPISDDPTRMFFIVFATMNPIEFEGTYPLSEAQLERFTYRFGMGAPSREEEKQIRFENVVGKKVEVVMNPGDLLDIQEIAKQIRLSDEASELVMRYLQNSRTHAQDEREFSKVQKRFAPKGLTDFIGQYVTSGCSRRRNFHMQGAALGYRLMRLLLSDDEPIGSIDNVVATVDDVKAIAPLTMEHVILLEPRSLGDDVTTRKVVRRIIDETPMP
jgi:MoxR-like ATPase